MDSKFIKSIQDRDFVLYEGLLNEAHNQGLRSIVTVLIQTPCPDNANVAVSTARVTMVDDDDAKEVRESIPKVFTGIGEASPQNVSKNIVPHIIQMSETRAKARALRDATNIGMTAFEELGGWRAQSPGSEAAQEEEAIIEAAKRDVRGLKGGGGPLPTARDEQLQEMEELMAQTGVSWKRIKQKYRLGDVKTSITEVAAEKITNDLKEHKEKKAVAK